MPSAMIHLLTARCVPGREGPMYLLGNLAPDYIRTRREKDLMHLRLEPDRPAALERLARQMDPLDPFRAGWLVHLLADLRWDTLVIPRFRAALPPDADWFPLYRSETHRAGYALYHSLPWSRDAMRAVLALDGETVIGCATMCYIDMMPTFSHPTGKRAHLMNVYTDPAMRRQGIAYRMVSMLIESAWNRGATEISLDATEAGRPLYRKLGFTDSGECMVLEKD